MLNIVESVSVVAILCQQCQLREARVHFSAVLWPSGEETKHLCETCYSETEAERTSQKQKPLPVIDVQFHGEQVGNQRAFSLAELLVIVVTLVLLFGVLIPAVLRARRQQRSVCANNLKQIGLAVKLLPFNGESNPAGVSTNYGGSAELIGSGKVFFHFEVMSNELGDPKVLVCPDDKLKNPAKRFDIGFSDTNVSYFFGVDSRDLNPNDFLAGDRNLAVNGVALNPGLFVLSTNTALSWTKAIHRSCGYIALADGSVQFLSQSNLTFFVRQQSTDTNRLAMP